MGESKSKMEELCGSESKSLVSLFDDLLRKEEEARAEASQTGPDYFLKVLQIMTECVGPLGLAGGQGMDLKSEGAGVEVGLDTLEWIHTYKTAALLNSVDESSNLDKVLLQILFDLFNANITVQQW